MDTIFQSFLMVFASEMGDKTQLLAFVLASRFKRPWMIMAGILVATLLNHGLATWFGSWVSGLISPAGLRWVLGLTFIGFGLWILIPDKDQDLDEAATSRGAFLTTLITFFFAEMGDKTQLATVALAAKHPAFPTFVILGTTLGMLVADGLAVVFGERLTQIVPMKWIRIFACLMFIVFGAVILFGWENVAGILS